MSLIKVKNSPFYYSSIEMNGKTYRRSTRTKDKRTASLFDDAHRNELIEKIHGINKNKIKLSAAINEYLAYKDEAMTGQFTRLVKELKDPFLHEIQNIDLSKLVTELRVDFGERTIKNYLTKLKMVMTMARRNGYEVFTLELPKLNIKKKKIDLMTIAEENKLLSILRVNKYLLNENAVQYYEQQDSYDFCVMLIDTGARLNEICKLKWEDVDLKERTVHLRRSKVNNSSILHVTCRTHDLLIKRQSRLINEWVFNARDGGHRKFSNRTLRKALKEINTKYTIHDLRHIYATRMRAMGVSLEDISKILGHSHTTMTELYAHFDAKKASIKTAKLLDDIHERNAQVDLQQFGIEF